MVRESTLQPLLHHILPSDTARAQKQFLPPEMYDYFSAVLELSHSPAHQ